MNAIARPDIFRYSDYREFLRDWLAFLKASQPGFSLRVLARQAGLASGYLPMVLGGKRPMSSASLAKILPFLGLPANERPFLENLLVLGTTGSHEARVEALERMKGFQQFSRKNPKDSAAYEYLTHWYYPAIREMAAMPDFQNNAEWIQARLRYPVPLHEIRQAMDFLLKSGYLELDERGQVRPPDWIIDCSDRIYRVALGKFHREIFGIAARSIDSVPSDERSIQGHVFSLDHDKFAQANEIVNDAIRKIRELGAADERSDSVYHLEVALFPLTGKSPGEQPKMSVQSNAKTAAKGNKRGSS